MSLTFASLLVGILLLLPFINGKNVLFITIDDLRPDLGCYQGKYFPNALDSPIISPNIDALAGRSLLLRRAYTQQAICSPSRTSFLTGRRPGTTKVYDLYTYFRESGGNFTTIPQYFKDNGYVSIGFGKIFHPGHASGNDDPVSWSEPVLRANASKWERRASSWRFVSEDQIKEEPLMDMKVAQYAIDALQEFAKGGKYENKNFFLAVGFKRPHLPFVSPSTFADNYPMNETLLPNNPFAPPNIEKSTWFHPIEILRYLDIKQLHLNLTGRLNESLPEDLMINLRRAYFSSITYVDSLVGQVLDEVKKLGFENDTIVSLLGDHGWHLGEHGIWGKETNFEVGTHVPFMVRVPGVTDSGIICDKITELVDLFPTLVDATGLSKLSICPQQSSNIKVCTEGESLYPLMLNPQLPWKQAAFSQCPRTRHTLEVMGYSIRTEDYRYTEWLKFNNVTSIGEWSHLIGAELYDHTKDPDENVNLADDAAHATLRQSLRQQLLNGWRVVRPPVIG